MPQTFMNFDGRRKETRHNICGADGLMVRQIRDLVIGAIHCPAGTTRTSENTQASTASVTRPQLMVNGYVYLNHWYKGNNTKPVPAKTCREHGRKVSALSDASAPGRVGHGNTPGGVLLNAASSRDIVVSPISDQMTPKSGLSAAEKNKRFWKKFRNKKRHTDFAFPVNPALPLLPSQTEEDWEKEIHEATLAKREMYTSVQPYGPEDVIHFGLADLTLKQKETVVLQMGANYIPSVHHPHPVPFPCFRSSTEPGQFADAD